MISLLGVLPEGADVASVDRLDRLPPAQVIARLQSYLHEIRANGGGAAKERSAFAQLMRSFRPSQHYANPLARCRCLPCDIPEGSALPTENLQSMDDVVPVSNSNSYSSMASFVRHTTPGEPQVESTAGSRANNWSTSLVATSDAALTPDQSSSRELFRGHP